MGDRAQSADAEDEEMSEKEPEVEDEADLPGAMQPIPAWLRASPSQFAVLLKRQDVIRQGPTAGMFGQKASQRWASTWCFENEALRTWVSARWEKWA